MNLGQLRIECTWAVFHVNANNFRAAELWTVLYMN